MPKRHSDAAYFLQALPVWLLYGVLRVLPPQAASNLGGTVGWWIGRFHRGTKTVRENLQLALPDRAAEHAAISHAVWRNLGRVLGEYPHLAALLDSGAIEVIGAENVPDDGRRVLFLTAHLANWELCRAIAARQGWDMASIYRPLNNRFLDPLLLRLRRAAGQKLFKKQEGGREIIRHARSGGAVGMVGDQRLSDGIAVPLFGHPALTTTLPGVLAVRFGARIVPAQVERLSEAPLRYRVTMHPVVPVPDAGTDQEKIDALTVTMNRIYEGWIAARPGQWLWMHDRWRPRRRKGGAVNFRDARDS